MARTARALAVAAAAHDDAAAVARHGAEERRRVELGRRHRHGGAHACHGQTVNGSTWVLLRSMRLQHLFWVGGRWRIRWIDGEPALGRKQGTRRARTGSPQKRSKRMHVPVLMAGGVKKAFATAKEAVRIWRVFIMSLVCLGGGGKAGSRIRLLFLLGVVSWPLLFEPLVRCGG